MSSSRRRLLSLSSLSLFLKPKGGSEQALLKLSGAAPATMGHSHQGTQPPWDTATMGHSHHGTWGTATPGDSPQGGCQPPWGTATMRHSHPGTQTSNAAIHCRSANSDACRSYIPSWVVATPISPSAAHLGSMSVPQVPIGALLRLAAKRTFVSNIRDSYVERASPHQGRTPVCSAGAAGVRWRQTAHDPA